MNCRKLFALVMVLLVIAAVAPLQAALSAEEFGLVRPGLEKEWQFDRAKLDMLLSALGQVKADDVYAIHTDGMPGITVNVIDAILDFTYKGKNYSFVATSSAGRMASTDAKMSFETWGYDVYEADGKFVLGYEENTRDGKAICVLTEASDKGVVVKYIDGRAGGSGKIEEKRFDRLSDSFEEALELRQVKDLKKGDTFTWLSFSTTSFDLSKNKAEVTEIRDKPSEGEPWVCKLDISCDNTHMATVLIDDTMRATSIVSDLELKRCSVETALGERGRDVEGSISLTTPIKGWEGVNDSTVQKLKVQVWTKNQTDNFLADSARQSVKKVPGEANSMIVIVRPEREPGKKEGLDAEIPDTEEIREALAATSGVESNSPEIKKKARKIVGKEKDPYKQALLLMEWVSGNISYTMGIGCGTALETLQSGRGDCSENAYLFVAFCRALGIPAEDISGWSISGNCMFGHAWARIYARGRWIEMDPTDGELASCTDIQQTRGKLVFLESSEVLAADHGKGMAEVDTEKLPWAYSSNTYSNRAKRFSISVPETAIFSSSEQGPASRANGKKRSEKYGLLFTVSWLDPAKNKSNLQAVVVATYPPEADMLSELEESGGEDFFDDLKYLDHAAIEHGDKKIASVKIGAVNGVSMVVYYVPVNNKLSLVFTCAGDTIHDQHFKTLPAEVAQMIDSIKELKPEAGAKKARNDK